MPDVQDPDAQYTGLTGHATDEEMLGNARAAQQRGDPNAFRLLPHGWRQDPETGQFRENTFWEDHGDTIQFLAGMGIDFASAGLFGGLGGLGGAAAEGGSKSMGFLDTLKQGFDVYNKASPMIDAFTRGTGSGGNGPSAASAISTTAGSIEAQRAAALVKQAQLQQEQDQLAQNRALLALRAPGMEASNAARGDVLANSKDVSFTGLPSYIHVPEMSGGLRPSMLSQNSRDLGANMSRNALLNNMSGKDVPNLTPLPTSTGYDTALQGITTGAGFLNALGGLRKPSGPTGTQSGGVPYAGAGTPGYPGDGTSPSNSMIPPSPLNVGDLDQSVGGTGGLDPAILEWWKQQSQGADDNG